MADPPFSEEQLEYLRNMLSATPRAAFGPDDRAGRHRSRSPHRSPPHRTRTRGRARSSSPILATRVSSQGESMYMYMRK
jgi:hypothetical protein